MSLCQDGGSNGLYSVRSSGFKEEDECSDSENIDSMLSALSNEMWVAAGSVQIWNIESHISVRNHYSKQLVLPT